MQQRKILWIRRCFKTFSAVVKTVRKSFFYLLLLSAVFSSTAEEEKVG